jgi:hypothetical protein
MPLFDESPPSGSVTELRAIATDVADTFGEFLHKQGGSGLASAGNFEATLRVPNLEHRLRLFITNDSIQEAPIVGRYDRFADGRDLACGVVARLSASGDRSSRASVYEVSMPLSRPLHGGWLFGHAGPMVRWNREFGWQPDAGVRIGSDALLWGLATRPRELGGYCQ